METTAVTKQVNSIWDQAVLLTDQFVNKQDLTELSQYEVEPMAEKYSTALPMKICFLKRLAYNPEEGIVDKLVNVYSSLHSMDASVFLLIRGLPDGQTEFYIGSRARKNANATGIMLQRSFQGNFPGIEMETLDTDDKEALLDECFPLEYQRKHVVSLSVSADFRKQKSEEKATAYLQGIEKFIDTMKGQTYTALFLAEPVSKEDCIEKRQSYENLITELSKCSKVTVGFSEGSSTAIQESLADGVSDTVASSISHTVSNNTSRSIGKTKGKNSGNSFNLFMFNIQHGKNKATTTTDTTGESKADTDTSTEAWGKIHTTTRGNFAATNQETSYTLNLENRRITDLISRLEYELKKMDSADSFGMWDTAVYLVSEDESTALIGANSIRSLVLGDESGKAESFINCWGNSSDQFRNGQLADIMEFLHYGMHPVFKKELPMAGIPGSTYYFTPAVTVGGNVLPSLMGLPMRSVPGVTVLEMAEFGRNIVSDDPIATGRRRLRLGEVLYMGKKENTPVELSVNSLSSHTFICGAPGSGKSNTVYSLLYGLARLNGHPERDVDENGTSYGNVHFLVIEPSKGEYSYEFSKMPGIHIFTTRTDVCKMLRLDPFAFPYEDMSVMEHIEKLENIFTACLGLSGEMPAILTDALEKAYLYCGWDLHHSVYVLPGEVKFPGFHDLLELLPQIINGSGYSSEAKEDYNGALVTRITSLTKGIAGAVFCQRGTIPDEVLFDQNTIIDLSLLGSDEARALVMGILVMKLENYRRASAKAANYPLRHVTVLEQAHYLLPRYSAPYRDASCGIREKSVEMLCNTISDMRTYGEGFIIVDQSPHTVADAAVSNTGTKILMRLPGESDIRAAAASVGLTEAQSRQIPMLACGQAIVKQGNWLSPVTAFVDSAPKIYFSRRLPRYDYEELKSVRGELIKKCISINTRNAGRRKIVDADKELVITYIQRQTEIAEHQKDLWGEAWVSFCEKNQSQREESMPEFIMKVLEFSDALLICTPEVKIIPMNPDHPEGEYLEALKEWLRRIEGVLHSYVTCDEEELRDIICQVLLYCRQTPPSEMHKICAGSVIVAQKAGGIE